MRRMRRLLAVVAATLGAALLLAAPAGAARLSILKFSLRNADGYRITVTASAPTVALTVRRPGDQAETLYIVHGKVTAHSIRADFPRLGQVAVDFQARPAGHSEGGDDGCRKGHILSPGLFRGTIEFRGEDGYTSVHAHRARGRVLDLHHLVACLREVLGSRSPDALTRAIVGPVAAAPTKTRVLAEWKQPLGGVSFGAARVGHDHTEFLAIEAHTRGRLAIAHIATARGGATRLASDPALTFARVEPPAPFAGSAEVRHEPGGGKSWTGDLTASFPGAPDVPLTGPDFKTVLGRSWGAVPTVPAPPVPKRLLLPLP